jgi:hypothetical protein
MPRVLQEIKLDGGMTPEQPSPPWWNMRESYMLEKVGKGGE